MLAYRDCSWSYIYIYIVVVTAGSETELQEYVSKMITASKQCSLVANNIEKAIIASGQNCTIIMYTFIKIVKL